jgi:D-proline reductase (dithiol) PrdB
MGTPAVALKLQQAITGSLIRRVICSIPKSRPHMGDLSEFPLITRAFLKAYRWREIDPVPWSPLRRPLSETSVALVSTAGLVLPSQEPFDDTVKGGDYTFRVIPRDIDPKTLIDTQRSKSYDHSGIHEDVNLAFPMERLRELRDEGLIGEVASRHLSFMGSITAPGRLVRETAPAAARILAEDGVGAALLVPV